MTGEIHEDMDEFEDNRPCFFKLIFGGFNTEQLVILYPFALESINLFFFFYVYCFLESCSVCFRDK
jgi:hypothetical protein